jgi:hypothetical protein
MVQVIENWTDVTGKVKSAKPAADVAEHLKVEFQVTSAAAVASFANLLGDTANKTVVVYVRVGTAAASRVQSADKEPIRLRIRKGGPNRNFAHPD